MNLKEKIIPAMILAPSAHNTQPWNFQVVGNHIDVFVDWDRYLRDSDLEKRQLYVSIGCAIENGVIAGTHAGYAVEVTQFPLGEGEHKPVARLEFQEGADVRSEVAGLASAISDRRNNRAQFDGKPLTPEERAALNSAQSDHIIIIENEDAKEKIAGLSAKGTFSTLKKPEFKEELSHWVRPAGTDEHDGMPGDAMGMPWLFAKFAPFVVKVAPIHKMQTVEVKKQIMGSSAIAVIATPADSAIDKIKAGQMLEHLWLEATSAGLAASVIAASVEGGEELRRKLKQLLNTNLEPQMVLRIGHGKKKSLKPTPRRTLEDCMQV